MPVRGREGIEGEILWDYVEVRLKEEKIREDKNEGEENKELYRKKICQWKGLRD